MTKPSELVDDVMMSNKSDQLLVIHECLNPFCGLKIFAVEEWATDLDVRCPVCGTFDVAGTGEIPLPATLKEDTSCDR